MKYHRRRENVPIVVVRPVPQCVVLGYLPQTYRRRARAFSQWAIWTSLAATLISLVSCASTVVSKSNERHGDLCEWIPIESANAIGGGVVCFTTWCKTGPWSPEVVMGGLGGAFEDVLSEPYGGSVLMVMPNGNVESLGNDLGLTPDLLVTSPSKGVLMVAGEEATESPSNTALVKQWLDGGWVTVGGRIDGHITALEVVDGNPCESPHCFVAVMVPGSRGKPTSRVLELRNGSWIDIGGGVIDGSVYTLNWILDSKECGVLIAGGAFELGTLGGVSIAEWRGSAWTKAVGTDYGRVVACAAGSSAAGPGFAVAVTDGMNTFELQSSIIVRSTNGWSAIAGGIDGTMHSVVALADESGALALIVSGRLRIGDGDSQCKVALWTTGRWEAIDRGLEGHVGQLHAVQGAEDGSWRVLATEHRRGHGIRVVATKLVLR